MNSFHEGFLVPFFDRFSYSVKADEGGRILDAIGLQSSLRQNLLRLFNVRNGLYIERFLSDIPTSIHYGLPDTLGISAQSATDLQRLERVLTRAILLYEPRLIQVRVQASPDPDKPTAARIAISALAAQQRQLCQVQFDLVLDGRGARIVERAAAPEAQP